VAFPESLAPLMAEAGERVFDDRQSALRGLDLVHIDGFALELFVIEEEAAQHAEAMLGHLAGLGVRIELRIATAMILWSFLPASIIVIKPMARA
jgi:hypothetical protein